MGRPLINIIGNKYGKLKVLSLKERIQKYILVYTCLCDCGNLIDIRMGNLISKGNKSCGCIRKNQLKKHGFSGTRTYNIWKGIKSRCLNPNDTGYHNYGGRGIKVCDRWLESYTNFLEDMGECPLGLQLDRINNDGNYEKDNCRWTTAFINIHNRRKPIRK